MQVPGHLRQGEAKLGDLLHGKFKQGLVVRFEMDLAAHFQHLPVQLQEVAVGEAALGIAFLVVYWGAPYAEHVVLDTPLCNAFAWIAVLAVLVFMRRWGNFENAFSIFMNRESWGLYVFHYLPLAVSAYYLRGCQPELAPLLCYLLVTVAAFAGAFVLNSVISRIPVLRWCVLGLTKCK